MDPKRSETRNVFDFWYFGVFNTHYQEHDIRSIPVKIKAPQKDLRSQQKSIQRSKSKSSVDILSGHNLKSYFEKEAKHRSHKNMLDHRYWDTRIGVPV